MKYGMTLSVMVRGFRGPHFGLVMIFFMMVEVSAIVSPFLDAFLDEAVWRSDLDWTVQIGSRKNETLTLKGYSCTHFKTKDVTFQRNTGNDGNIVISSTLKGLSMQFELEVDVSSWDHRILTTLDLSNGDWDSTLKFTTENSRLINVTLDRCETKFHFQPSSIRVKGLRPIPTLLFQSIYSAIAPLIGPKIADPTVCAWLSFLGEAMNLAVKVSRGALDSMKPPQHIWPSYKVFERVIKPKRQNSLLLFAPYDESLPLQIISGVINDILGVPAASYSHHKDLVINHIVRQRISHDGSGTIEGQFNSMGFDFDMMNVSFRLELGRFRFTHLDTFNRLVLMKPISKLTFKNALELEGPISYELELNLSFVSKLNGVLTQVPFNLSGSLEGIRVNTLTTLGFDLEILKDFNFDHSFACAFGSLAGFALPLLQLSLKGGSAPKFSIPESPDNGLSGDHLPILLQSFEDAFIVPFAMEFDKDDFDRALKTVAWYMSPAMTIALRDMRRCPMPVRNNSFPPPVPTSGFVRFDELPFTAISRFVNDFMSPPNDPDLSLSRVLEIVARVINEHFRPLSERELYTSEGIEHMIDLLTLNKQVQSNSMRHKKGVIEIGRSISFGPFNLLGMFPSLNNTGREPSLEMSIGNLTLGPLNDIDWTALFVSSDMYTMMNTIEMNKNIPLTVSFDFRLEVIGILASGEVMSPAFTVQFDMEALRTSAEALLRMAPFNLLRGMTLSQMMTSCLSFSLPENNTLWIKSLDINFAKLRFRLRCQEGPCYLNFTRRFVRHISSIQSNNALRDYILKRVRSVARVLSGEDQHYFGGFNVPLGTDKMIHKMQDHCAGGVQPPNKRASPPRWIPPMEYVMLLSALGLVVQFALCMVRVQRNHKLIRWEQSSRFLQSPLLSAIEGIRDDNTMIPNVTVESSILQQQEMNRTQGDVLGRRSTGENLDAVAEQSPLARLLGQRARPAQVRALLFNLVGATSDTGEGTEDALYLLGVSKSLFRHPAIPWIARYSIALLLFFNFCIFVIGVSFFTMGTIVIVARVGEQDLKPIPMMSLTLDTCIDMMVEGRALLFALFIGISSGILPWIRVAVLAFVWLAPPTVLPVEKRGKLVENLEGAGKWCLAEVYLFTVLMTVVSVQMTNPTAWTFLPPETFRADIECTPKLGLFAFLVATWVSLFLNHSIVYFHRSAVLVDSSMLPQPVEPSNFSESTMKLSSGNHLRDVLLRVCILIWPMCLALALYLDVLEVSFLGFSGFGIDMLKESDAESSISISLVRLFPLLISSDPTHSVNRVGLFLICFGYALFILIAPPLCCVFCFFICFIPLKQKHRLRCMNILRILNAWSTTEVLACTMLVIVLQLHKFFGAMSGMITFLPDWIGPFLRDFGASEKEATAFGVEAKLYPFGFSWLLLASVLGMIVPKLVYIELERAAGHGRSYI